MNFIKIIIQHFINKRATHKADTQLAEYRRLLYSPQLFSEKQRVHLKSLFPTGWCHLDNIPQEDIFKIALTMTLYGYKCNSLDAMKHCMYVLSCQNIFRTEQGNPAVIKRYNT